MICGKCDNYLKGWCVKTGRPQYEANSCDIGKALYNCPYCHEADVRHQVCRFCGKQCILKNGEYVKIPFDIIAEIKRIHARCDKDDSVHIEIGYEGPAGWWIEASINWMSTYDDEKGNPVHFADTSIKVSGDDVETILAKLDRLMTEHINHEAEE